MTKITKIDGWLLNFYPFITSAINFKERLERRYNFNQPLFIKEEIRKFPEELIDVPLTIFNKETLKETELSVKTGLIGMVQEEDGVAKAEIGWFITNKIDVGEAQKRISGYYH